MKSSRDKLVLALRIENAPDEYPPGPCALAAGVDADGFGLQLPEGLIPVLDEHGRFKGWQLAPGWEP